MIFSTESCPACREATQISAGANTLAIIVKCRCGHGTLTAKPINVDQEVVVLEVAKSDGSSRPRKKPVPPQPKKYRYVNTSPSNDCCEAHANMQGCDCDLDKVEAERTADAQEKAIKALETLGIRLPLDLYDRMFPNPTGCPICRNPRCDNPGGKH